MKAGQVVLVRVAMPGGWVWMPGRICAAFPQGFGTRRYDVAIDARTVLHNVSDLSLREVRRAA